MVLRPSGHADNDRLDVAADVDPVFAPQSGASQAVEGGADGHRHRGRAADSRSSRCFGVRSQSESACRAKNSYKLREQWQFIVACLAQRLERCKRLFAPNVTRNQDNSARRLRRRLNHAGSVASNGAIDGQRSFVKQVQRPNVQRSSGQVNPCRRSRFDSHFDLFPSSR